MSRDTEYRLALKTWEQDPLDPERVKILFKSLLRTKIIMELLPVAENLQPVQFMLSLFPDSYDEPDDSPTLGNYGIETLEDLPKVSIALSEFFQDLQYIQPTDYSVDNAGNIVWDVGTREAGLYLQNLLITKGGIPASRTYVNQRDQNNTEVWNDSYNRLLPNNFKTSRDWKPDPVLDYTCPYSVEALKLLFKNPLASEVRFSYQHRNLTHIQELIKDSIKYTDFQAAWLEFFKLGVIPSQCNLEFTTWIFAVNGYVIEENESDAHELGTFYGIVQIDNKKDTSHIIEADELPEFRFRIFQTFIKNQKIQEHKDIVWIPKNFLLTAKQRANAGL